MKSDVRAASAERARRGDNPFHHTSQPRSSNHQSPRPSPRNDPRRDRKAHRSQWSVWSQRSRQPFLAVELPLVLGTASDMLVFIDRLGQFRFADLHVTAAFVYRQNVGKRPAVHIARNHSRLTVEWPALCADQEVVSHQALSACRLSHAMKNAVCNPTIECRTTSLDRGVSGISGWVLKKLSCECLASPARSPCSM